MPVTKSRLHCTSVNFPVQELERNADHLDESLLATANAWMRKAAEDKLDGKNSNLYLCIQLSLPVSSKSWPP